MTDPARPGASSAPSGTGAGGIQADVSGLVDQAKAQVSGAVDQARDQAASLAQQAQERALQLAEEQKRRAAEQVEGMAHAVDSVAEAIGRELPPAAPYVREVAQSIHSASTALRERSVDDLIQTATDFARRQPLVTLGGALFAGFAFARFLKATDDRRAQRALPVRAPGQSGAGSSAGRAMPSPRPPGPAQTPASGIGGTSPGTSRPASPMGSSSTSGPGMGAPGQRPTPPTPGAAGHSPTAPSPAPRGDAASAAAGMAALAEAGAITPTPSAPGGGTSGGGASGAASPSAKPQGGTTDGR